MGTREIWNGSTFWLDNISPDFVTDLFVDMVTHSGSPNDSTQYPAPVCTHAVTILCFCSSHSSVSNLFSQRAKREVEFVWYPMFSFWCHRTRNEGGFANSWRNLPWISRKAGWLLAIWVYLMSRIHSADNNKLWRGLGSFLWFAIAWINRVASVSFSVLKLPAVNNMTSRHDSSPICLSKYLTGSFFL